VRGSVRINSTAASSNGHIDGPEHVGELVGRSFPGCGYQVDLPSDIPSPRRPTRHVLKQRWNQRFDERPILGGRQENEARSISVRWIPHPNASRQCLAFPTPRDAPSAQLGGVRGVWFGRHDVALPGAAPYARVAESRAHDFAIISPEHRCPVLGRSEPRDVREVRTRREINAPSGLSFCPPASLQKGFHIMDIRPFLRLAGEQNSYAI
jgi:hypothetical protein